MLLWWLVSRGVDDQSALADFSQWAGEREVLSLESCKDGN